VRNAKCIGRIGGLAAAPGVGNIRRAATRMTVSIGIAVLVVMATVVPAPTVSPDVRLSAAAATCTRTDVTCALILGTSGVPTPDDFYVESVKNQFIAPIHPDQIDYVTVTTPEGLWPLGGPGRLFSLLGIGGSPEIFGPGGPAWDVPWWNLTGLFDLTLDQSIQAGVGDLEDAMAAHPNKSLVIFGYSQSALIANREKRKLAEQYQGTTAPDINFVLFGDPNLPNGGLFARFPGLYLPILDWSFNGPAPTDTQFDTIEITRQYDLMADFPLYPLNLVSDLNALLGFFYVHTYPFDVSLADPSTSPPVKTEHGRTTYYFFETEDLPLFGPLRTLGVPEPVIDVVEPFFRVLMDLGYDRSIQSWEPAPARLIPTLDPATVAADLFNAIGEGITNAAALFGSPEPLSISTLVTADQEAAVDQLAPGPASIVETVGRGAGERGSQLQSTVGSQLPQPPAVSQDDPINEGISNAAALSGSPPSTPGPVTADQGETVAQSRAVLDTTLNRVGRDVGDGVSPVLPAVGSQLPKLPAVTHDDLEGSQRAVSRELAATRDQINDTTGEVNSATGNRRTIVRSAGERGSTEMTTRSERQPSVRDAATKSGSDTNKIVTPVSDSIKQALSGGQDDDRDSNGEDEAE
jgi:hypothetical protein